MAISDRKKQVSKSPAQDGMKGFMYDPSTGKVMGRTAGSWFRIIIFYIIFYAGLAAFFCINFYIFYLTLNMDAPKFQQDSSLIGTNPGLGFRPMPDARRNPDSTLIWFSRSREDDFKFWVDQLADFIKNIETSEKAAGSVNLQSCTIQNGKRATSTFACQVDVNQFQPCTYPNEFGYRLGEPCILIKLNKIYGWIPEPYGYDEYDRFNEHNLREDLDREMREKNMPRDLALHILNETQVYRRNEEQLRMLLSTVWISCDGENVADIENVGGIYYYPIRGIGGYYFPFLKQQGYQSPFIFIQLKNPAPGVVINVECKAFAKNVKPDRMNRLATTHFEILID